MLLNINCGFLRKKYIFYNNDKILRPSKMEIKKKIFNWLNEFINNSMVLDFFSGTGAFGFEAISRGAISVTMFEKNIKRYNNIYKNILLFNLEYKIFIYSYNCLYWLKNINNLDSNILILDPPYDSNIIFNILDILKNIILKNKITFLCIEFNNSNIFNSFSLSWIILKISRNGILFCCLIKMMK